jgi:triosephosphate isomerase
MRKKIIAGNWKMYKTLNEAVELVNALKRDLSDVTAVDIVVCPPFVNLAVIADMLIENNIRLGAQNLFWENEGAFTGEVSAPMIRAAGAQYVIIGHSERRQYFQETNETVNKRLKAALKGGLLPIVCVGENLAERESGRTFDVVKDHITGSLAGLSLQDMERVVIAYEPVWAIGTGKTATSKEAQEVHQFIRGLLSRSFDAATAGAVRIQYGGSVKPENAAELMSQPDIDGALVGGASLKADSFAGIIRNAIRK